MTLRTWEAMLGIITPALNRFMDTVHRLKACVFIGAVGQVGFWVTLQAESGKLIFSFINGAITECCPVGLPPDICIMLRVPSVHTFFAYRFILFIR